MKTMNIQVKHEKLNGHIWATTFETHGVHTMMFVAVYKKNQEKKEIEHDQ